MISYNFVVLAKNTEIGASYNISKAINQYTEHNSILVVCEDAPYTKHNDVLDVRYDSDKIDKALEQDNLILFVINLFGFSILEKHKNIKAIHRIFFWTGTSFMENSPILNGYTAMLKRKTVFAMPDLIRFSPEALPLLQPMDFEYRNKKYKNFTVCHSAGYKIETDEKGTKLIEETARELEINYSGISRMNHEECITEKSKCHVFVDKVSTHSAGIGKSGLEAIWMGIPTICSMDDFDFRGRYKDIPVIPVKNKKELKKILLKLKNDEGYYFRVRAKTLKWRNKLSMESTINYVMGEFNAN